MTHTESQLNVLALNSGSSSLKFGLYGVGSSRIERLLSGEVESIGDKATKCHAEDSHGSVLLAETGPIPGQREATVSYTHLDVYKRQDLVALTIFIPVLTTISLLLLRKQER